MEEEDSKGKKSSDALKKAIIGLVGTLLTVCGGLTGALVTAGITIYQVEREAQQIALPAPGSDQALIVDTSQIAIDRDDASRLASDEYLVDTDLGLVIPQPRAGWNEIEETTFYNLVLDEAAATPLVYLFGLADAAWDEQPVYRIRYSQPVEIQYQEDSTENDIPIDVETMRDLIGSDTLAHYSQVTILTLDKQVTTDIPLASIALTWGPDPTYGGGANRIVAYRDSQYILIQATSTLKGVNIDGHETDLSTERWALFAEGPQHYYVVELNYVPAPGQSLQVWEDLQAYLDDFRIIQ
ncbi:MAG: hypothetical protein JXA14_17005 [Anaerolineae bacterium]|nr:hypothetical protein [Anaerolineae bacterium]